MSNDGLLLGAAIIGGGYLTITALSGEDGAGGGSAAGGVVNIIEDAAAAAQGITEIIKNSSDSFYRFYEVVDDGKGLLDDLVDDGKDIIDDVFGGGDAAPSGDKASFFETASNAGGGFGAGIGGALGSAFLGMYEGAMTAGAHLYGRNDVNPENVFDKFKAALPVAKDNIVSGVANNIVDAVTLKNERNFAESVYNTAKDRVTSGSGSSGNSSLFTPRVLNTSNVSTPTFKVGNIEVANVRKNLEVRTTAPAAVRTNEAKKTIYGTVRSWFN